MISVFVFDKKDYDIFVWGNRYSEGNITNLHTVEEWCKITESDWCFNEAFFNFVNAQNSRNNCSGRTLQYLSNPEIGDIGYGDRTERILVGKCVITGWKYAVKNGLTQRGLDGSTKRARNMDGVTADGRYIHVVSDRQTETYVAAYTINEIRRLYGTTVKTLFVQDAGGSASMYSNISKLSFYPEGARRVPSVICVKRKTFQTFARTLHRGVNGDDTMLMQMTLGGIENDGIFGAGTDKRLKQAQKALKIPADGWFGPQSAKAMGYIYR